MKLKSFFDYVYMSFLLLFKLENSKGEESSISQKLIYFTLIISFLISLFYIFFPYTFVNIRSPDIYSAAIFFGFAFLLLMLIILFLRKKIRKRAILWIGVIIPLILAPLPSGWILLGYITIPFMVSWLIFIFLYSLQLRKMGILFSILFFIISIVVLPLAIHDVISYDGYFTVSEDIHEKVTNIVKDAMRANKTKKEIAIDLVDFTKQIDLFCDQKYFHPKLKDNCKGTRVIFIKGTLNEIDPPILTNTKPPMESITDCHRLIHEYKYATTHQRPSEENCAKTGGKLHWSGCFCVH